MLSAASSIFPVQLHPNAMKMTYFSHWYLQLKIILSPPHAPPKKKNHQKIHQQTAFHPNQIKPKKPPKLRCPCFRTYPILLTFSIVSWAAEVQKTLSKSVLALCGDVLTSFSTLIISLPSPHGLLILPHTVYLGKEIAARTHNLCYQTGWAENSVQPALHNRTNYPQSKGFHSHHQCIRHV